jgi:hypothetical protein
MGMMTRRNVKARAIVKVAPTLHSKEVEEVKAEVVDIQCTKTEINRMPIAELKKVAGKIGVDNFDTMTGAELKKVLIKELGV